MPKWLDRILGREQEAEAVTQEDQIRSMLSADLVQLWPTGLPVTPENVAAVARDFHVLRFTPEALATPVLDDNDEFDWHKKDEPDAPADERLEQILAARDLCSKQPHCKRALALYVNYVFGADFSITLKPRDEEADKESAKKTATSADRIWKDTLKANRKHWGPDEFCRRTYRDGEQFTRMFPPGDTEGSTFQFRFIDPEDIRGDDDNETKGIVTAANDIALVEQYELYDESEGKVVERIPAAEVVHTKIDADSSQKRGNSRFESVFNISKMLIAFVETEVIHRNMQSSVVLVRKVNGPASAARLLLDNAKTSVTTYPEQTLNREKIRPGSIYTTHKDVELEFAQPKSDFSDASPLGKFLVQHIAAATGWTYSMLSSDGGDGNFASALVQESPMLQMVLAERKFFRGDWEQIYELVIGHAADAGKIEGVTSADKLWEEFEPEFRYGDVVSRQPLQDAQTVNLGVMNQTISRAEGSRRMGADPDRMRREIEEENASGLFNNGLNGENPDMADKGASTASNAKASGTNQGGVGNKPAQQKDKL